MTPQELLSIVQDVLAQGPEMVVVNEDGLAVSRERAKEIHGVAPDTVFIRKDGFTVGAPTRFEGEAYAIWLDEWVAFLDLATSTFLPIEQYKGAP